LQSCQQLQNLVTLQVEQNRNVTDTVDESTNESSEHYKKGRGVRLGMHLMQLAADATADPARHPSPGLAAESCMIVEVTITWFALNPLDQCCCLRESQYAVDLESGDDHWERSLAAAKKAREQAMIVERESQATHAKLLAAQEATRNFEKARREHMAIQVRLHAAAATALYVVRCVLYLHWLRQHMVHIHVPNDCVPKPCGGTQTYSQS
jgi:hypothetical protein